MAGNSEQLQGDRRGLLAALLGDGRFLIIVTGLCLTLAGGFALFQSATGHFLPHDIAYLGMTADELCSINECRIVHFMFHDRVSFGGVLIAIGALYMWLAEFPLKMRAPWAWWTIAASGVIGFLSFLSYLGYGYLDSWHAVATILLLPMFVAGLVRAKRTLGPPSAFGPALRDGLRRNWTTRLGAGRLALLAAALGIVGAGLTISAIGMTSVFVPQDLAYMGLPADALHAINPKLVPLIAHDRAGFGGGLCSGGIALLATILFARPSRDLWEILAVIGVVGFSAAIGVHFTIGYTDPIHLAPACAGAALYAVGLALAFRPMMAA
ncbi:MAG TPA: hypothetical protein VG713_00085 [Pirellulales bacterium]|nr:hypothetical protein [Pirellulales bacterium]